MNIPDFNAEVSLYKTTRRYVTHGHVAAPMGGISPALATNLSAGRLGIGGVGGGRIIDPNDACCCTYRAEICSGAYCWPASYRVCISCPFGYRCECTDTGPYCSPPPVI